MKHIDLFSGIGGFALAAQWVWGDDYENVLFCDNNEFCREVIKKNFGKESLIYGDIREVTRERVIADTKRMRKLQPKRGKQDKRGWPRDGIDLLTGGFPCQPFSHAGKRRGTEDNRYLWPEMYRVIKDFKPRWVIAENVYGILNIDEGMVFEQVCLDLERGGYEVQAFIIPAVSTNAPHCRDRVWIVAHNNKRQSRPRDESESIRPPQHPKSRESRKQAKQEGREDTRRGNSNAPDTEVKRLEGRRSKERNPEYPRLNRGQETEWQQNWLEVATKFCRVDDGLPVKLDGLKLTKAGHRVERLKALGNAIVPQVAVEIMRAIKEVRDERNNQRRSD